MCSSASKPTADIRRIRTASQLNIFALASHDECACFRRVGGKPFSARALPEAFCCLSQAQDDKIAELKRKLAAAQPAFAMAGAEVGGSAGRPPTLEQVFAGLGSGDMLAGKMGANNGCVTLHAADSIAVVHS